MEITLDDWILNIDKEIHNNDALPIVKRVLISIKEQTLNIIKERGYTYDMFVEKIIIN